MPKVRLTRNSIERKRLTRLAASSSIFVVRVTWPVPRGQIERSRGSSPLDQKEHHEHDDDAGRTQGLNQGAERSTQELQGAQRRGQQAYRVGLLFSPLGRLDLLGGREILVDVLGGFRYFAQRGAKVIVHRVELRLQVGLILGHFGRQGGHLPHGCPGRQSQHREAQDCRNQYSRDSAQPAPLKPAAHRAKHEAQQEGERQRNQQAFG